MKTDSPAKIMTGRTRDVHLRAERLGYSLPPLILDAERVAATVAQGIHGRRRAGMGESFWQFRPYSTHDSFASIDWRRSARSDALYVREREWEAAQTVLFWPDRSPSMDFSSGRIPTKADRALLIALATAVLLARGGEHVAFASPGSRRSTGRGAAQTLLDEYQGMNDEAGLPDAAHLPAHAFIVLITDGFMDIRDMTAFMGTAGEKGIGGHLLIVNDPAEETLPYSGRIVLEGTEGEGDFTSDRVEALRPEYRKRLTEHRNALRTLAGRTGWTADIHRTDHPAEMPVATLYAALKDRG